MSVRDDWLGLLRLELEVNVDNVQALALHRRIGFEVEGTHRGHIFRAGPFVDACLMARLNGLPSPWPVTAARTEAAQVSMSG